MCVCVSGCMPRSVDYSWELDKGVLSLHPLLCHVLGGLGLQRASARRCFPESSAGLGPPHGAYL